MARCATPVACRDMQIKAREILTVTITKIQRLTMPVIGGPEFHLICCWWSKLYNPLAYSWGVS